MIWLNPAAWFALAVVAAPILVHLLIQRRAERLPFPTLRFLQPTRLASIRRHLIEDLPLLAIRIALLTAAVAALAGPLLITAARRQAWDRRTVRAVVSEAASVGQRDRRAETPAPDLERTFEGTAIADGIRRASIWLSDAPPARRELVIASPLPIGSITQADIDGIPASVGIRFERAGMLPPSRTVPAGRLLAADGAVERNVMFDGDQTTVLEAPVEPLAWPIEVFPSKRDQPTIDAAIAAVRSQRVWAGPPDRRARLYLGDVTQYFVRPPAGRSALFISQPWIADAIARLAGDRDLQEAASRVIGGLQSAVITEAPWQTVASAADRRPLVVASGSEKGLVVLSAAPASDVVTPLLLRSMANAIASVPDLRAAEVTRIADSVLQRWSRPAAPISAPRADTVDRDDRRWLWLAVVVLLLIEMWIRRSRDGESRAVVAEDARVA